MMWSSPARGWPASQPPSHRRARGQDAAHREGRVAGRNGHNRRDRTAQLFQHLHLHPGAERTRVAAGSPRSWSTGARRWAAASDTFGSSAAAPCRRDHGRPETFKLAAAQMCLETGADPASAYRAGRGAPRTRPYRGDRGLEQGRAQPGPRPASTSTAPATGTWRPMLGRRSSITSPAIRALTMPGSPSGWPTSTCSAWRPIWSSAA